MKKVFPILLILAFGVNTLAWQKIVECKSPSSDGLIIDRSDVQNPQGYYEYQVVISGAALQYLRAVEAIPEYRITNPSEFVSYLTTYDGIFMTFLGIREGLQMRYWFHTSPGSVYLRAERDDRISGTSGPVADWTFSNCNYFQ